MNPERQVLMEKYRAVLGSDAAQKTQWAEIERNLCRLSPKILAALFARIERALVKNQED